MVLSTVNFYRMCLGVINKVDHEKYGEASDILDYVAVQSKKLLRIL